MILRVRNRSVFTLPKDQHRLPTAPYSPRATHNSALVGRERWLDGWRGGSWLRVAFVVVELIRSNHAPLTLAAATAPTVVDKEAGGTYPDDRSKPYDDGE